MFYVLSSSQDTLSEEQFRVLERFAVVMYSRTCPHQTINEARQALFAQGNEIIENIPPKHRELAEHIKQAAYQAGQAYGIKRWNLCGNSQFRQNGADSNHKRAGLQRGLR